jgi:chloramphenicol-sensitive protein RarD
MQTDTIDARLTASRAAVAGVSANIILGVSSVYWKALGAVSSTTLLGYRILVSLLILTVVLVVRRSFGRLFGVLSARLVLLHMSAAALVVINWGTFIWASIHGHVVESGLGYLVAPFVTIGAGALWFKERLGLIRLVSLVVIALAFGLLLQGSHELEHWVYLTIGGTWGGYACLKKITRLDPFSGLFLETLALTALMPLMLWLGPFSLDLPAGLGKGLLVMLALCGAVSVVPLALFSFAAANLTLSVMGFLQFVLPSTGNPPVLH